MALSQSGGTILHTTGRKLRVLYYPFGIVKRLFSKVTVNGQVASIVSFKTRKAIIHFYTGIKSGSKYF